MKKREYLVKGKIQEEDFRKIKALLAKDFSAMEIYSILGWSTATVYGIKPYATFADYRSSFVKKDQTNGVGQTVESTPEITKHLLEIRNALVAINKRLDAIATVRNA